MSPVVESASAQQRVTTRGHRIINGYRLDIKIGKGSFSVVYLAKHLATGDIVAIKVLSRAKLQRLSLQRRIAGDGQRDDEAAVIRREIVILKRLRHPHIIALLEVINDPEHDELYLVLELAIKGPLMRLDDSGNVHPDDDGENTLPEATARKVVKGLVRAVRFAHRSGVAHRDIKPENILLTENDECKLADFGVSHVMETLSVGEQSPTGDTRPARQPQPQQCPQCSQDASEQQCLLTPLSVDDLTGGFDDDPHSPTGTSLRFTTRGTIAFMAPELLDPNEVRPESIVDVNRLFLADIWSLGVTIFTICAGRLPWHARGAVSQLRAIRARPVPEYPESFSPQLIDFLSRCMCVAPADRASLRELAHHPWLRTPKLADDPLAASTSERPDSVVDSLASTVNNMSFAEALGSNMSFDGPDHADGQFVHPSKVRRRVPEVTVLEATEAVSELRNVDRMEASDSPSTSALGLQRAAALTGPSSIRHYADLNIRSPAHQHGGVPEVASGMAQRRLSAGYSSDAGLQMGAVAIAAMSAPASEASLSKENSQAPVVEYPIGGDNLEMSGTLAYVSPDAAQARDSRRSST